MSEKRKGFFGGRVEPDAAGELVRTPVVHPTYVSRYPAPVFTNHGQGASGGTIEPVVERPAYPCLRVLDGAVDETQPEICGGLSVFYAKDNGAKYGHVCRECWEGFPEAERAEYAERMFPLLNAVYGKFAEVPRVQARIYTGRKP